MTAKTLAVAEEPDNAVLPPETPPPYRILVVEDDTDIRRLNTEVLANAGYYVDAAEDGEDAWIELHFTSYDLLLTDNLMPRVSGIELLKKLHFARMSLPVIMVTGVPPTEELARHPWLQIEAMLFKPYTVQELLAVVRNVLHEADQAPPQVALPDWQSQRPTDDLRL